MDGLLWITPRWLQPDQLTPTENVELITLDCFLQGLPGEEKRAVGRKPARIPRDIVSALECVLATLEMGKGEKWNLFLHENDCYFSPSLGPPQGAQEAPLSQPLPQNKPMHMESECCATARPFMPWLA